MINTRKHTLLHNDQNVSACRKKQTVVFVLSAAVVLMALLCLFIGSSNMTFLDCIKAIAGKGTYAGSRIIWNIRLPRVIAALIAGSGLSLSGLIMQTVLGNPMASPSTLGISNASVFGANLSIIALSGGVIVSGNNIYDYALSANPFAVSFMAFVFSVFSIMLILGLCRIRSFSPEVVVLSGIAVGAVWTAATTLLQFYATDVGLSAAVIWSFGDLGRATYTTDLFMLAAVSAGFIFFLLNSWKYNAFLSGDTAASGMGVNVPLFRFISMLLASVITAVCVSFLGVIGFVGIICPHVTKKLIGHDHRYTIPVSMLCGSLLLTAADALSRSVGGGASLPVGAITSLLGAPFFIAIIFSRRTGR